MATFYDDMDEIHRIILDTPYESDGSIQSWEDINKEDSDDLPGAENSQDQPLADVSGENEQMSNSQNRVATASRKRVPQWREKVLNHCTFQLNVRLSIPSSTDTAYICCFVNMCHFVKNFLSKFGGQRVLMIDEFFSQ